MPKFSLHSKLNRIQTLIAAYEQGNTPQARDVALVLEPQQRSAMDEAWAQQKAKRVPEKSASLSAYEQQLKVAVMWRGRLERYKVSKPTTYRVFVDRVAKQAELQLKLATELQSAKHALVQALQTDADITAWLDRQVLISDVDGLALDDMPRCVTSRSKANLASTSNNTCWASKLREIKLAALRDALALVQREIHVLYPPLTADEQQQQNAKLKRLLGRMKGSDGRLEGWDGWEVGMIEMGRDGKGRDGRDGRDVEMAGM